MIDNSQVKIAVALSGGVDSAVAAKLLKDEGYEIIGLFLKLWKHDGRDDSLLQAKKVADFLKVPFYVISAEKQFKQIVVGNFIAEFENLRTPNPCVLCNPEVKFKMLINEAKKLGCEKIATGHYARVIQKSKVKSQNCISKFKNLISDQILDDEKKLKVNRYQLKAGVDGTKDQSYMLYRLNQEQLSKVVFPLGELSKKEVREMAKRWNLPVAEQKESQEICFLQNTDYREFLKKEAKGNSFKPGDIVDTEGNVVGKHEGLINYTIGQRKSINQNLKVKSQNCISKFKNKKPLYTKGFDAKRNWLIVGEDREIYKNEMVVSDIHWIDEARNQEIEKLNNLTVKIRSQAQKVKCQILISRNQEIEKSRKITILFCEPQRAVTPGQSAVFYLGEEVLGGGTIEE